MSNFGKIERGQFVLIPDHPIEIPPMGYANTRFNLNDMTADVTVYNDKDEQVEVIHCIVLIEAVPEGYHDGTTEKPN